MILAPTFISASVILSEIVLGVPLSEIEDRLDGQVYVVDGDEFAHACLNAHNNLRKLHHVGELIYDSSLATSAGEWAKYNTENKLKPAKHASKADRMEGNFGENIFSKAGFQPATIKDAVIAWYNERLCWNFEAEEPVKSERCETIPTGHMTQEIWKSTERVGCGMAFAAEDKVFGKRTYRIIRSYIVARYSPPGNRKSAIGFNVLPPDESIETLTDPEALLDKEES